MALGTADGVTAAAASTTDTDPVPAVTAPPIAEHISSFLLHTRRRLVDNATATAASTAPVLPAPPFPDVTVGTAEGATATAAPATDAGMGVDTDATPSAAVGSTQDATGKKRRRKRNHTARASRTHRQRVAGFTAARNGNTGPDSDPDEEHSAGEGGEW